MKAKKSYKNGGKVGRRSTPLTAARDRMIAARKEEDYKKRVATAKSRMKERLEEDKAARKYSGSVPAGKKVREYKKGGRMGLPKDISGMGKMGSKMKKLKPIGPERSMQVEGIMSKMKAGAFSDSAKKLRSPGKSVAEAVKPRKKKRRLRRK